MPKALVTGSAGFIGRHMVKELEDRGFYVDRSDITWEKKEFRPTDYPYGPYVHDALGVFAKSDTVYDLLVHCAYNVGGRVSIDGINTNFVKNLQLDSAMFEWAIRTKQKHVLYFSSSAAYPIHFQNPMRRSQDYRPYRLHESDIDLDYAEEPDKEYGWAKLTGERLARNARRNGLKVSVVRPASGYAEDQSLNYPFPSIVKRAKEGDLTVWGPPGQCRDWIHVDDVIRGSLAVVESETEEPVNLCTGVATEMGELACKIAMVDANNKHVYSDFRPERDVIYMENMPTGVFYRVLDPVRMLQYYQPQITLEEGIRRALR